MGSTLPSGSPIRIQLTRAGQVGPGDVVAFISGRRLVVHRIVARGRRGAASGFWLARGDAEFLPDPPVARDAVLGPVELDGDRLSPGTMRELRPAPRPGWPARGLVALARIMLELDVRAARGLLVSIARLRGRLRRRPATTGIDPPA